MCLAYGLVLLWFGSVSLPSYAGVCCCVIINSFASAVNVVTVDFVLFCVTDGMECSAKLTEGQVQHWKTTGNENFVVIIVVVDCNAFSTPCCANAFVIF